MTATVEEQLSKPNVLIIDARESEDKAMNFDFIGAKKIPVTEIADKVDELGPGPILLFYGSASRTGHAEKVMKEHGYTDIVATSNKKAFEPHLQKWRVLS